MTTLYQLTITGQEDFRPPKVNIRVFLDHVQLKNPKLLHPAHHRDLMLEFARFAGLKPDRWGMNLSAIQWLLERSPDIERACRSYRSDAF